MPANNLTRQEARERAGMLSGISYRVALDLSGGAGEGAATYGCEAEIRFSCATPGASTFLEYLAPSVSLLELNGVSVPVEAFDGGRIHLDGLNSLNTLRVVGTSAFERSGVGMHRFVDPVDGAVYCYTDSEPYDIHRVFPCFDQPDLKASLEISVQAPAGWHVSANAPALERPDPGAGGRWIFEPTEPLSTYIMAVVAGDYHVVEDRHAHIALAILCRRSLAEYLDPEEIFDITKAGLDFYDETFAYPYPFHKYDQAFVPEFNAGAMENAGIITFSERAVFRSRVTEGSRENRAETILHEMAHMWFGDLVTMQWWDDLWLNESFATFMSNHALVHATRFTGAWTTFSAGWKTWAYRQDQLPSTHPIAADMPDIDSVKVNFDGITYAKGASVLRQLVAWVGEDPFFAGVRHYFRRHAYGNTTLADFLGALEETSGRDLAAWSQQWLQTASVNTLRGAPDVADGRFSGFAVLQEAPAAYPTLRDHRLAVGLYDDEGGALVRRRRAELDVGGPRTPVPDLAGEAVPAVLLLNDDDLTYAKIRLDPATFATLRRRLRDLADPLARALCWAAAWDMVRDGELPTRDYLALVLANIDGEEGIAVSETLLAQAGSAAHVYSAPARREAAVASLAAGAWARAAAAEPGSDRQLVWVKAYLAHARSADHLSVAAGLLDGTGGLEGLVVDTELRWAIVRCLAAGGSSGGSASAAALIEAEAARDPTDAGARHAAAARASRPSAAAKEEAWGRILDPATSFATMRATIGGFQQPDQADLLRPYRARYFEQVPEFFAQRNMEVALGFTSGMYPHALVEDETVAMTDAHLAAADPAPPVRRLLAEGKDGVQRAMRARACDEAAEEG
ncbi:MAG TPA: aminopeptidase N [Actinomycetota bacterium]|nr:aminopeptidase N [Actinomycetota bacterium]